MKLKFYQKAIYALAIILTVLYLIWRIFFTIPTYHHLFSFIIALLLLLSELLSNFTAFILIWLRLRFNKEKEAQIALPEIDRTTIWPDVDVIIVTHDEDVKLLQKTVNAAVNMTPGFGQNVNIVIADDGNRPEVRRLALESRVQYIDMPEGNQAAKAGNINHALKYISAPLLVVFDADMIPYQTFLLHSVPYFIKNKNDRIEDDQVKTLGFLQTPQSFYNADIFQYNLFSEKTATNEQDFFSRDINILNGSNGVAIFTGSGALFMREAVNEAGGFPEKTLTEDFELGVRINMAGYTSISTLEPESSGMTPMDVRSVIKQRVRWARGVMQSSRNLHIFINRKIPLFNRMILINVYLYWWSFLRRMLFILAPILFVLWHVQLVDANFWLLLIFWAPGYLLLHYVMDKGNTNIRGERWGEIQETFFAPYLWLPVLLETLGIKQKKFKVTAKVNKQSTRALTYSLPYLILWILDLWSLIVFNYGKWGSEIMYGAVISFWLITHLINLTFSLYISWGRPINRQSERFSREVAGTITTVNNTKMAIKTVDVSDNGLSFVVLDNHMLHVDDHITVKLVQDNIQFMGIVKVARGQNRYGAMIEQITPLDQNNLYGLIYNGKNMLLPWEQDSWMTIYDALLLNITYHIKNVWMRIKIRREQSKQ